MFILSTLVDTVSIPPHLFHLPHKEAIPMLLNAKYANRILPSLGLCICVHDLLSAPPAVVGFGTGAINTTVTFSLLVFRPFKGEIIAARVKGGDERGLQLSTEFFEDVYVPRTMMFEGCEFVDDEAMMDTDGSNGVNGSERGKVWIWRTGETELYFDPGTVVHVRVEKEMWDVGTGEEEVIKREEPLENGHGVAKERKKVHYAIEASMAEPGLGAVEWW